MKKKQVKSLGRAVADDFGDDDDEIITPGLPAAKDSGKDMLQKKVKKDAVVSEKAKSKSPAASKKGSTKTLPAPKLPTAASKAKKSKTTEMDEKPERAFGEAPVDEHVPGKNDYKVLNQDGAWLTKTMVENKIEGNSNKFYIGQVLQERKGTGYLLFFRWGRIGSAGQQSATKFPDSKKAIAEYNSKCRQKLSKGSYTELKLDFNYDDEDLDQKMQKARKTCTLTPAVADLIISITSVKMFEQQVSSVGYDTKRMPLGKLSKEAIDAGYHALKNLEEMLDRGDDNHCWGYTSYSQDFYRHIPHAFGHAISRMDEVADRKTLQQKFELLKVLNQFKTAQNMIGAAQEGNLIDNHYEKLATVIRPIDMASPEAKLLVNYANTTTAAIHASLKVKIEQIFSLHKATEAASFKGHLSNHLLVWQGVQMTSCATLLASGCQLPSADSSNTAFPLGKGIYFTEVFSKAAHQCFVGLTGGEGYLLLAEVALGEAQKVQRPDPTNTKLQEGFHHIAACGRLAPAVSNRVAQDSYQIPLGPLKETEHRDSMIQFGDYVVFDPSQVKMRYLVKITQTS